MRVALSAIVLFGVQSLFAQDECTAYGENSLSSQHLCQCVEECGGLVCKSLDFVAERLGDPEPEDGLCDEGFVCCCSCPPCDGFTPFSVSDEPTPGPTVAPTYKTCNTEDAFNVAFILDESGSVSEEEWINMVEFVDRLIRDDLAPLSYATLYEFSSLQGFIQFLPWTPVEDPPFSGTGREVFTDALYANDYNDAGKTYTWDAINRVLDGLFDYRLTCTDDCDRRDDILILLTDGRPTDQVCANLTERMNQTDVDVVIIGVNMTASEIESIACLDVRDFGADVFSVPTYSDFNLRTIELGVREKTCNGDHPLGDSDRPSEEDRWIYPDGSTGLGPVPTGDGTGGAAGAGDT